MIGYAIVVASALYPEPKLPAIKRTPEDELEAAIREVNLSMMSFYATGALFCPSQELAVECWGKYLDLQLAEFRRQVEAVKFQWVQSARESDENERRYRELVAEHERIMAS